jgi:RNA polymerase sigma-70 factor, ECF subfamily
MGAMAERLEANMDAFAAHDLASRFGSWMASEQRRVFLLCRRMLQDPEDADSATQDTFFKAWQALKAQAAKGNDAQDPDDPAKWLTRIAVNTCLDRLRSRRWQFWRKRPNPEDESAILNLAAATGPDAEDRLFARQIAQRLERAVAKLSLRQQAAFTLRHYEDRSLAEIAGILQLDVGTVKVHLFRATEKLREELHDLYIRDREENETHRSK